MSGPPMSAELVDLALDLWQFRLGSDGEPFALPHDGPAIAVPLRGVRGVRSKLAALYRTTHGRPPSQAALADAMVVLEGEAVPDERPIGLRVVRDAQGVRWLDLGNPDGHVIAIADGHWRVTTTDRVVFRRTALTGQLPTPVPGASLEVLRELSNVSDADWPLYVSLLVAALDPDVPHPIAAVTGEQGTGKSTEVRRMVQLLDPGPAPLRTSPRDVEQWAVAASGSWLVALDNVSRMPEWLSDALCRAATGDGFVRRRLYSDADVSVLAFRRVVLLTFIDAGALRGDLADRLVTFDLDRIDATQRRTDADLEQRWRQLHPLALGALLDLAARAFDILGEVHPPTLSRMADYHRIVAAVDRVTGWDGARRYATQGERLAEDVVAGDAVAETIVRLLERQPTWEGTAGDLLGQLDTLTGDRKVRTWPTNGRAMAGALKRCAPALRTVGVQVEGPHRTGHDRDRLWTLARVEKARQQPSAHPQPSAEDGADGPSPPLSMSRADGADGADGPSPVPLTPCRGCGDPADRRSTLGTPWCSPCWNAEADRAGGGAA
jgi:hypothetical protein